MNTYKIIAGLHYGADGTEYNAGKPGHDLIKSASDLVSLFPQKFMVVDSQAPIQEENSVGGQSSSDLEVSEASSKAIKAAKDDHTAEFKSAVEAGLKVTSPKSGWYVVIDPSEDDMQLHVKPVRKKRINAIIDEYVNGEE